MKPEDLVLGAWYNDPVRNIKVRYNGSDFNPYHTNWFTEVPMGPQSVNFTLSLKEIESLTPVYEDNLTNLLIGVV